jgi:hypothetical protein
MVKCKESEAKGERKEGTKGKEKEAHHSTYSTGQLGKYLLQFPSVGDNEWIGDATPRPCLPHLFLGLSPHTPFILLASTSIDLV